jgi:hypothetical protein
MRGPLDAAACGAFVVATATLPLLASLLAIVPEPGSGETSHFELPS